VANDAPAVFPLGDTTVIWTATDCNGNSTTATQTIHVVDTTAPVPDVASLPDVAGECSAEITSTPAATDNCAGVITGTTTDPLTYTEQGTYTVTWIYADGNGNTATQTQTVIVDDTTPSSLTVPQDVTAECTGPDGTLVDVGQATASDACCAEVTVANDAPAVFPLGDTTVIWTATDCNGNSTTATQTIHVVDTTAPEIALSLSPAILWPPNHKMVEIYPAIQTSDVCCSNIILKLVQVQMNEGDSENTFDPNYDIDPDTGYIGSDIQIVGGRIFLRAERAGKSDGRVYTITYEATDCVGNSSSVSGTVKVPHDQR
jgi:hypothetical protein